jgi:nucleotide-binding universal stress UspA family protein
MVVYPSPIPTTEILYATDFSEPATRALACAKLIARRSGVLLRALHVIDLTSHNSPAHSSFNAAIESARRALRINRRQLRLAGIHEAATLISGGSISLAIRDAAIRYHSTMIVMGLHGEPGIRIPNFGGNVRRLFRSAPCPLLAVGLRGTESRTPALERVLYVTDTSPESAQLAQQAWPLDSPTVPVAHFVVLPPDAPAGPAKSIDVPPGIAPLRIVAHRQAADLILAKATEAQADLIVVGLRGGGCLDTLSSGSVVRTIWTKGTCPVLTTRSEGDRLPLLRERLAAIRNRKPAVS